MMIENYSFDWYIDKLRCGTESVSINMGLEEFFNQDLVKEAKKVIKKGFPTIPSNDISITSIYITINDFHISFYDKKDY